MLKPGSWTPKVLPAASFRQRVWKLASLSAHGLLFAVLMAPGGAAQLDLRQNRRQLHVVLIAPPKGTQEAAPPSRKEPPSEGRRMGLAIALDQMTMQICEDPTYELIKVLRRSGGYIGVAEGGSEEAPVLYVDKIIRVSDLFVMGDSRTHRLDDYFAVRLIDVHQWTNAARVRNGIEVGPRTAVFALFSQTFATQLVSAIRESAESKGMSKVKSVTIRFDDRKPSGIVIEEISSDPMK